MANVDYIYILAKCHLIMHVEVTLSFNFKMDLAYFGV